jgi:hypothetical protein
VASDLDDLSPAELELEVCRLKMSMLGQILCLVGILESVSLQFLDISVVLGRHGELEDALLAVKRFRQLREGSDE